MLEKYVAALIVPYLAKYVENIDEKQLRIDIWSGKASLQDLILRASVLDSLLDPVDEQGKRVGGSTERLPVYVHRGVCKSVSLHIPVRQLRSKPVILEIGELLLTLRGGVSGGSGSESFDHAEAVPVMAGKGAKWDAVAASKAKELDQFEEERRQGREAAAAAASSAQDGAPGTPTSADDAEATNSKGYFSRLGELIVNNIIVKIKTVHIRYEDEGLQSILGAILGDVQLLTIDESTGDATFTDPSGLQKLFKRLVFSGLQLYCDDPREMTANKAIGRCWYTRLDDWQPWYHAMRQRVRDGNVAFSTVFGPVAGAVDVKLVFKQFVQRLLTTPYMTAHAQLQQVMACLTKAQYTTIARTISVFTKWQGVSELARWQPRVPVRSDARAWWRYAIRCVRWLIAEPRRQRLLQCISSVCVLDYRELYRDVVRRTELSAEKKRTYRFVCRFMTVPDMIAGRKHVYALLENEIYMKRKDHEARRAAVAAVLAEGGGGGEQSRSGGWLRWIRGGPWSSTAGTSASSALEELESEEAFFKALETEYGITGSKATEAGTSDGGHEDDDAAPPPPSQLPPTYVWASLSLDLPYASGHIEMENGESTTLKVFQLFGSLQKFNKPDSVWFHVGLHNITLINPASSHECGTLIPHLIEAVPTSGKSGRPHGPEHAPEHVTSPTQAQCRGPTLSEILCLSSVGQSNPAADGVGAAPMLEVSGVLQPPEQPLPDTKLDVAVRARLLPLRIVADPGIILSVIDFFNLPAGIDVSRLASSTLSAASAVGSAATMELRRAMSSAKGMFISVDVSAPIILLPRTLRASGSETAAVVSLGRVRLESFPLTETEKRRRISTPGAPEDTLYYKHSTTFSKLFVELTTVEAAVRRPQSGFMILPEVTVAADILHRIEEDNVQRDRVIARLRVPRLHLACSIHQVYVLTSMIETWISRFKEAGARDTEPQPTPADACDVTLGSLTVAGVSAALLNTTAAAALGVSPAPQRSLPPTTPAPSPPPNQVDLPKVRVELLVQQLGLDVLEDNPDTLKPYPTPRFSLTFESTEFILALRTVNDRMLLLLKEPRILDLRDQAHPILQCTSVRVDVRMPSGQPKVVGVVVEPSTTARLGTPFMELLETIMDVVNLILYTIDVADESASTARANLQLRADTTSSDLAYQLEVIRQQCSVPDRRVVNVSIDLEGTAVVEFMNRQPGDTEDHTFAVATATDVSLFLKKNKVTMNLTGKVSEVTAAVVSDRLGLHEGNRTILRYTPHASGSQPSMVLGTSPLPSPKTGRAPKAGGSGSAVDGEELKAAVPSPHLCFTYRKSRPVTPVFEEVERHRVLTNAAELRYSSAVELELGPSAACLDVHTVMLLQGYFTTGFFSRVTQMTERPLYNGHTFPPVCPGPRLLMSIRVVATDITLNLPLDARTASAAGRRFSMNIGNAVVQTSLHAADGQQTTSVSLNEIGLRRPPASGDGDDTCSILAPNLLSDHTSVEVAVRSQLDLQSEQPMYVDVKSEDLSLRFGPADIVDLCTLIRQNLTCSSVDPREESVAQPSITWHSPCPQPAPPLYHSHLSGEAEAHGGGSLSASQSMLADIRDILVSVRLSKACLSFTEDKVPIVQFDSTGVVLHYAHPEQQIHLHWRGLEFLDTRGGVTSALVLCDEGTVSLMDTLTTPTILMNDFGVRRGALKSTGAERLVGSITSSEALTSVSVPIAGDLHVTVSCDHHHGGRRRTRTSLMVPSRSGDTDLLSVSVLSIDFTLRRFALSDQWLTVYDIVCNETVIGEMSAPQSVERSLELALAARGMATTSAAQSAAPASVVAAPPPPQRMSFRCTITTPSVVVPLMTTGRASVAEVHASSLLVDVFTTAEGNRVAVRLKGFSVVDMKSGERIVSQVGSVAQHRHKEEDVSSLAAVGGGGVTTEAGEGDAAGRLVDVSGESEALAVSVTTHPSTQQNEIQVSLGQLDVLLSLPILQGLADYFVSPEQPLSKIASLGVMREQRARMEKVARDMMDTSTIAVHVLWQQPRIVLVADALDLSNRAHNIETHLGVLHASATINKRTSSISVSVKLSDFNVTDFLSRATLRLRYSSKGGKDLITLTLGRTVALLHPDEVERLTWVMQRNLLLSRAEIQYYAELGVTAAVPQCAPVDSSVPTTATTTERTVQVRVDGLLLALHDVVGVNTHTATLSSLEVDMSPAGDVAVKVPEVTIIEHFSGRCLLRSGGSASTAAAAEDNATDLAISVEMTAMTRHTRVRLSRMTLNVLPRGIGSLVNTLLSIQIPGDLTPSPAGSEAVSTSTSPVPTPRESVPHRASALQKSKKAKKTTPRCAAEEKRAVRTLEVSLPECRARFILGDYDVADARLSKVTCMTEHFRDESSKLHVSVGSLVVTDTYSAETLYLQILSLYEDNSSSGNGDDGGGGGGSKAETRRAFVNYTLWVDPPRADSVSSKPLEGCGGVERPYYAKRMQCEIGNLAFKVVPEVARALGTVFAEVKQHISDGNRGKAYEYMSDQAQASLRREHQQLTKVDVVINRPHFLLVSTAMSTRALELYPGRLAISSKLVTRGSTAWEVGAEGRREDTYDLATVDATIGVSEVMGLHVERMGMKMIGADAFKRDCHFTVVFSRPWLSIDDACAQLFLGLEDSRPTSELNISIPTLMLTLSKEQSEFAMDVLGAFTGERAAHSGPAGGLGLTPTSGSFGPATMAGEGGGGALAHPVSGLAHRRRTDPSPPAAEPEMGSAASPLQVFRLSATIDLFEADVLGVFRLTASGARVLHHSSATNGSLLVMAMERVCVQHGGDFSVDAETEGTAKPFGKRKACANIGGGSSSSSASKKPKSLPSPTKRRRYDSGGVDVFSVRSVRVRVESPPPNLSVGGVDRVAFTTAETIVDVTMASVSVAASPTILFDTRELLYLPFCLRVFHIPLDPLPALMLVNAVTTLSEDLTLDYKHVLLTASRTRCCYHLDLNRHRLVLTGLPSSMIVLNEGCQLTISNGTIVIPGMYTLGSFVSYAPGTSLLTTDTCVVEKQFLNVPNLAFNSATQLAFMELRRPSSSPLLRDRQGTLQERVDRVMASFRCNSVEVRVLSEEVADLNTSLHMQMSVKLVQDTEHGTATSRTVAVRLTGVSSAAGEEHVVLPTNVTVNVAGVDNVSVSLAVDSVEVCTRTTLLRALVEVSKDFGTAFLEESTIRRVPPVVQFESETFTPLVVLVTAGECRYCGQLGAYIGASGATAGALCFRCCTGRDCMPATDFRIEVPLVDAMLVGSRGELSHFVLRDIIMSVDTNLDARLNMRGSFYNFSNTAAVWEPFIETFEGNASGSLHTHDYEVRVERLDCVVSPLNLGTVSRLMEDYTSTASLEKELRRKFRVRAQRRTACAYNGRPMFVQIDSDSEGSRVEDELDFTGTCADAEEGQSALSSPDSSSSSVCDVLQASGHYGRAICMVAASGAAAAAGTSASKDRPASLIAMARQSTMGFTGAERLLTHAQVTVTNYCNTAILAAGWEVAPFSGVTQFRISHMALTVARKAPIDADDQGYIISLAHPLLYVQGRDVLIETAISLTREDGAWHLNRSVAMAIYPIHRATSTVISVENKLGCPVVTSLPHSELLPGERVYIAAAANLRDKLSLRPVSGEVTYKAGISVEGGRSPTLEDILSCTSTQLQCFPDALPQQSQQLKQRLVSAVFSTPAVTLNVWARQEEVRGGVPTFVITIEPRYRLFNSLPYDVTITVTPDADSGSSAGGKPQRYTISLAAEEEGALPLVTAVPLHKMSFILEARQVGLGLDGVYTNSSPLRLPQVSTNSVLSFSQLRLRGGGDVNREMTIRFVATTTTLRLCSPFLLANHAPLDLTIRECTNTSTGELRRSTAASAERNFTELPAMMGAAVAASSITPEKEEMFVNVYHGNFVAMQVPLHVQQRGLIIMIEGGTEKGSAKTTRKAPPPVAQTEPPTLGRRVYHLAYMTQIDSTGSLCVTLTPRWVMINRTSFPLYVAAAAGGRMNALEATAAATAAIAAEHGSETAPVGTASSSVPTATTRGAGRPARRAKEIDDLRDALLRTRNDTDSFLRDKAHALALAPGTAVSFYQTPLCSPELGYRVYVLQDPLAPLHGTPIEVETIHTETAVIYNSTEDDDGGDAGATRRDRFVDVSVSPYDPYTYVIFEEPVVTPFLLLNRIDHKVELRDVSAQGGGRLLASAAAGCGAELMLDATVTTRVRLTLPEDTSTSVGIPDALFDLGRSMTPAEVEAQRKNGGGIEYRLRYGKFGQVLVEIIYGHSSDAIARTYRASPPIPVSLLLNVAVLTVSVVTPGNDVLFAAITDTRFNWRREHRRELVLFSIKNFQVDNQSEIEPCYDSCVLALRKSEDNAAISGLVERHATLAKSLLWIEEARLDVAPIVLRVSDTLLVSLARFGQEMTRIAEADVRQQQRLTSTQHPSYRPQPNGMQWTKCPTPTTLFNSAPLHENVTMTRVIVEKFIINPLVVRVWLNRDGENDFLLENMNVKDAALLSMMIPSCEDVQVSVPGIVSVKRSGKLGVLLNWLVKSYMDALIAQLRGVILQYASSLPLIGVPFKLFSGIGGGAVRLFREPIEGLSTSRRAFAQGLASGSAAFALEFAGGGLGAFSNLADAGSRLLSMSGGVSEQERRNQNTISAFASGLRGVYRRPMEGHAESGTGGLLKGTLQGLVGVVANPMSGLLSDFSKATGTIAKLVTDQYVPKTKRLRPIRPFHANGGVAAWRAVVAVFHYQRISAQGTTAAGSLSASAWSSEALRSGVDGPAWYPCRREGATHGPARTPIPAEAWALDRYRTSFDGWGFSNKYYGVYGDCLTPKVRTRRQRWVALVRPLPHSAVATYLHIALGMEEGETTTAAASGDDGCGASAGVQNASMALQRYAVRGAITAWSTQKERELVAAYTEKQKRKAQRSASPTGNRHARSTSEFFAEAEHTYRGRSLPERMRTWTATGRHMDVKASDLHAAVPADEARSYRGQQSTDTSPSPPPQSGTAEATGMRAPATPRVGRVRGDKEATSHSRSASGPFTGGGSAAVLAPAKPSTKQQQPEQPVERVVEVYEYERRRTLLGWNRRYLSANCPPWQDPHGREVQNKSEIKAPVGWRWAGEWTTRGGDTDGWSTLKEDSNTRRRLWQRKLVKLPQS